MKVRLERPYFKDSLDVLFYEDVNEKIIIVNPVQLIMKRIDEGDRIEEPTFSIRGKESGSFLQSFVNEAYKLGIRPEQDGKTITMIENEMKAMKFHLEDMRKLVFEKRIK